MALLLRTCLASHTTFCPVISRQNGRPAILGRCDSPGCEAYMLAVAGNGGLQSP